MRTATRGRFAGNTGVSARTYHRDRRGRFASAQGAFADRFAHAKTDDDARAAAPVAFEEQEGSEELKPVRGLDDYQGTLITAAVSHYTAMGSETVNAGLRGATTLSERDHNTIDGLSLGLRRSRLTSDVIVHRGVGASQGHLGGVWDAQADMTGRSWRDDGFSSVSAAPHVASRFAFARTRDQTPTLMRILVPKGTPALALGSDESELLLPAATTMTVVADHGSKNGVRHLDVIASYDGGG